MRRSDRELNKNEALKIIDECNYAIISCIDNGEVFSLPLSIVREEMSIFIHGATSGSKARLFIDNKECKIVAVSYAKVPQIDKEFLENIKNDHKKLGSYVFTTEYKSAIANAKANLVENEEKKLRALRLLSQKYCSAYMNAFESATPKEVMKHINIYEFKITSISAKAKIIKI